MKVTSSSIKDDEIIIEGNDSIGRFTLKGSIKDGLLLKEYAGKHAVTYTFSIIEDMIQGEWIV